MKLSDRLGTVFVLALLCAPAAVLAASPGLTVEKLEDGVFAFLPTEEAQTTWQAVSNSGAVVLDDSVLIYDSHWTPSNVLEALGLLRRHTRKPVRYVVNSHFHADHTGGAGAYGGDVELITHHTTRDRLIEYYETLPESLPRQISFAREQAENGEDETARATGENILRYSLDLEERLETGTAKVLASLTFDRKIVLHRGSTAEIYFFGRGHTDGDAVLFLPEKKIAFMGDLLWVGGLPNVGDGYTRDWISTLEAALELGAERYVPGHGPVADAAAMREMIDYLKWLRNAVEPYARDGKGVEAAREGISLPERFADWEFPRHLAAGIAKVYGELEAGE